MTPSSSTTPRAALPPRELSASVLSRFVDTIKTLAIDAPPRRLISALAPLWKGEAPAWLEPAGYIRRDGELEAALDGEYVLDGETYPAGDLIVRAGPVLEFVT